jgi:GcrA cell cycle regulator
MSWTEEKVLKLKELWGKGNTASEIAEIIGGISRNAVIGKAHRLNLSAKIKTRTATSSKNFDNVEANSAQSKRGRKSRFKSLIIEKDFEPENPKQLEELDENSCKWPIGHPDEKNFYFCGRSSLKEFSYCKLHLLYAFQPKGKKEDVANKEEVPEFIEKKIQSA